MSMGWRRAFCTIPIDREATIANKQQQQQSSQSPSPSPSPRSRSKLGFLSGGSNPSTPRLPTQQPRILALAASLGALNSSVVSFEKNPKREKKLEMASTVDTLGEPIPTSAVLMASSKHIATKCRSQNLAFLNCKKDDPNPEKCLDKGHQVTRCVFSLLRELHQRCTKEMDAYAGLPWKRIVCKPRSEAPEVRWHYGVAKKMCLDCDAIAKREKLVSWQNEGGI
ncbi:hypothetical protein F0562_034776 [Nyssa sinensis]|uniref:CHCH domain-containing protein n=1 Tax=Nyssa sinensis TaxID=561372 RepID=A0A5J5AB25_9ASTE|nr:hypothetical protein F0562_034776 [Nyssa sinensis]